VTVYPPDSGSAVHRKSGQLLPTTVPTGVTSSNGALIAAAQEPTSENKFWRADWTGLSRYNLVKLFKIKMVEAAGVEPASVLQTRKLLIDRTDKKDKTDISPITACKMHTKSFEILLTTILRHFRASYHKSKYPWIFLEASNVAEFQKRFLRNHIL